MNPHEEEEDTGPSVDSNDPEERIAARRIRIQKRIEAKERESKGEDSSAVIDKEKEEQSKSRRQIEGSRQRLVKLKSDGTELVTNVRVAADARETQRRTEEEENTTQRLERLASDAKTGADKFDDIIKKWDLARNREIPQDLYELLKSQQDLCNAMIDEKNKLINDFQMELKSKDDQYVKDLKKQAEDVDLIIDRIEEQIKSLMKSYQEELSQIEKAHEEERRDLLELNRRKWDQNKMSRQEKEVEYVRSREKRVEDYQQQIQHLRVQDAEEYNMVKIKLETDVQILEQQLQQMRATYQLNQEKLEYNFQVLKKRDDENTITKSQQKRKITRLQDVQNNMKIKLAKQEKQFREENQALADDYKRITEQFKELQKKSKHFQLTDLRIFADVWLMKENEAKDLVHQMLEQDRIIHQQQLGLKWTPPDLSFAENVGPIQKAKKESVSAQQVLQEVMSSTSANEDEKTSVRSEEVEEEEEEEQVADNDKLPVKTVKSVLELLCDESGFLVESKLVKLLAPLEQDERSLMKLDAIFGALGVETEEDIQKLATYFLKRNRVTQQQAATPSLQDAHHQQQVDGQPQEGVGGEQEGVEGEREGVAVATAGEAGTQPAPPSTPPAQQPAAAEQQQEEEEEDVELARIAGEGSVDEAGSVLSEGAHSELIHPNDVLQALRDFVMEHSKLQRDQGKHKTFSLLAGEERDSSEDQAYWQLYANLLTDRQEKVWTALLEGFEKYSQVLTERTKALAETESLKQQNAELRMLLHQYINSKVNQELEVPPTKVLNLEYSS